MMMMQPDIVKPRQEYRKRCGLRKFSDISLNKHEKKSLPDKLHKLKQTLLNQEYVKRLIKNWNVLLYQLPPYHTAVNVINMLQEKLVFLLYCLYKPVHQGKQEHSALSDELKLLFVELLLQPKLSVLPEVKYPSLDLHESVKEFCDNPISFENFVHVLCDFLGISPEVRDSYKEIDAPFQYHFTYEVWIKKYFENNYVDLDFTGQEELVTSLTCIGYTAEKSKYIVSLIDKDKLHLQSPIFWALRYLDCSFYHQNLLLFAPKFAFQSDIVDEWFEQYCDFDFDDDDKRCKKVRMINLSSSVAEKEKVLPLFDDTQDFVYLFHGTTYQSCLNLIRKGIRLGRGSAYQDFSSWQGFYLSEELEDAKKWGSAGRGDRYAVLVYKVEKDIIDAEKQHGLDLADYFIWNNVVKYCRSTYRFHLEPPVELKNATFVRGATAAGQAFLDGHLGRDFLMGDVIQLCIRDQKYASEFGDIRNVFCALFY